METATIDASTNTNPLSQIAFINKDKEKKPYDVKIKNYNPDEPKISVNMKYSDKQRFRKYKTKTEPKLFSKIMIDEEDDIVKTIKKAFGIEDKKKLNYTDVETSGTPYYEEPQQPQEQPQEQEQRREIPNTPSNIGRVEGTIIAPKPRRQKKSDSASTEITSEIADPPQISPGRMRVLMQLKKAEEFNKKHQLAEEEAKIRAQKEKERILELSRIAKEEQARDKILENMLIFNEDDVKKYKAEIKELEELKKSKEFNKNLDDKFYRDIAKEGKERVDKQIMELQRKINNISMVREFKYRKYRYSTLEDAAPLRDYDRMQKYMNTTRKNYIHNLGMDPYELYKGYFFRKPDDIFA